MPGPGAAREQSWLKSNLTNVASVATVLGLVVAVLSLANDVDSRIRDGAAKASASPTPRATTTAPSPAPAPATTRPPASPRPSPSADSLEQLLPGLFPEDPGEQATQWRLPRPGCGTTTNLRLSGGVVEDASWHLQFTACDGRWRLVAYPSRTSSAVSSGARHADCVNAIAASPLTAKLTLERGTVFCVATDSVGGRRQDYRMHVDDITAEGELVITAWHWLG
ncbi:hypothetical protein [Asanoa siamensis]|uniref:Serine/threonine protein kinase n=1 Tax=Asanoa siamensis TaxID=926357 RepID=A0ABQ4CJ98_9ACTN|nr:hypothetical protein [Asanoa siamensis]GIF71349.1 hypothetical protein Asi02nite_08670 [Asanoa siamensis]